MNFIDELRWRGLLHDMTPGLEEELAKNEMPVAYIGFDPTAPSITIGNYVQIMVLKLFQQYGGKPIVLMGGATGRVGDPSGKTEERNLLAIDAIDRNLEVQRQQFLNLLNFTEGENRAELVDNYNIYSEMSILDFLRDVGKNLTINYMMSKDSVKNRLESGMSFTEFSYQLLQGNDFVWLYQNKGCRIQMGGSDQWGNITTGTTLVSKMLGNEAKAFAVTIKLLTKKDGTKFGKSEKGNIWMNPDMTTPYEFYQFWLRSDDEDVVRYNRLFSLRTHAEIEALEVEHAEKKGARVLQKALAEELTIRIHGEEAYKTALQVTDFIYNKKMNTEQVKDIPLNVLATAFASVEKSADLPLQSLENLSLREALVSNGFFESNGEVNRAVKGNALSLNKVKVADAARMLTPEDLLQKQYMLIEFGKETQFMLKFY